MAVRSMEIVMPAYGVASYWDKATVDKVSEM
jgi:hypothetical protein